MKLNRVIASGLVPASLLFAAAPVAASPTIDQQQSNTSTFVADVTMSSVGQFFKTGATNLSGAGIYLGFVSGPGSVSYGLWSGSPDAPGASLLAQGTTDVSDAGWADVFWDPVAVTSGSTYYLSISGTISAYINGTLFDSYSDGYLTAINYSNQFFPWDYAFRTYTENDSNPGNNQPHAAIPEPASWALMLGGFGLVGAALRRRKRLAVSFG